MPIIMINSKSNHVMRGLSFFCWYSNKQKGKKKDFFGKSSYLP